MVADQLTAVVIPNLCDRRSCPREQIIKHLDEIEDLSGRDRATGMHTRSTTQLTVEIKAGGESSRSMLGQGKGVQLLGKGLIVTARRADHSLVQLRDRSDRADRGDLAPRSIAGLSGKRSNVWGRQKVGPLRE
jgi:hypothetical protein